MFLHFLTPHFVILSTILVAFLTTFASFIHRHYSSLRNFILIATSGYFFLNVLIIDVLFLKNISLYITLLSFGVYSIAFHTEPIGLIFLNMVGFLWIWSLLYTINFIKINNLPYSSRFLFFVNLSILSGILIALSANLFTMFIFYEILTLSTIPLITHSGGENTYLALHRYLKILMVSSMMLLLPALVVIYAKCHSGKFVPQGFIQNYFTDKQAVILLLMLIFGISKAALYPLHGWIINAMVASYPVSAILHAVIVVKAGVFCIYKILSYVFGLKYLQSIFVDCNWLIFLPIVSILYASIKALKTNNIKMILAYSTISQLSVALLSSFMLTPKAIGIGMLHLVSHSFAKLCLFYSCGNIYSLNHSVTINDLAGIGKTMPKTSLLLLLSSLSLVGFPPLGGFISKFYIMLEAVKQDQILIMFTVALSSIFSSLYLGNIIVALYRCKFIAGTLLNDTISNCALESRIPKSMFLSIIICLSCSIFFFFIVGFINKFLLFLQ
jgi:multicomponent Na+:H+ antiporter subunit D